ncbi:MAG: Na/Pi cotransporter family protein, partial [Bacilli bacterium]
IIVGAFALMFSKKNKSKYISMLILSFGLMFFGLDMMGSALKVLAQMPLFSEFAVKLSGNKFAGVGLGLVMTLAIQSSSATIGILQSLYADGLLTLQGTLPILFGDNIGTTITAVLAAVGGSIAAKRAAAAHVSFNVIGTMIFLAIFPVFYNIVVYASTLFGLEPKMQIAFAHAFFNVSTTIIMLPFVGLLVKGVTFLIKDNNEDADDILESISLEKGLINESPKLAITLSYKAAHQMAINARKMIKYTKSFIETKSDKAYDRVVMLEENVNEINRQISEYLVDISEHVLDEQDSILLNNLFYNIKDLERVGDYCINIVTHFEQIYTAKEELSDIAKAEIDTIITLMDEIMEGIIQVLDQPTIELCESIALKEEELDQLEVEYLNAYLQRYKNKERMGINASMLYSDILSDFERMGDHCYNISNRALKVLV